MLKKSSLFECCGGCNSLIAHIMVCLGPAAGERIAQQTRKWTDFLTWKNLKQESLNICEIMKMQNWKTPQSRYAHLKAPFLHKKCMAVAWQPQN